MKTRLIKSLILVLLCFSLMGTGTYAWLCNNRKLKADSIDTQLAFNGAVIINIDIYKYIQETNTIEEISDQEFPAITAYDSIFLERNVNTPLIFKITLLGEFKESKTMDLVLDCSSSEASRKAKKTSNLIYVKAQTKENVEGLDESSITKEFHSVVDYFKTVSSSKQFMTVRKTEDGWEFVEKKTSITYPLTLTDNEKENPNKTVDIYMILDYNEDLILAHELDKYGEIEIMQSEVKFDNDFTQLQFKVNY